MNKLFLHQLPDAKELFESISHEKALKENKSILPIIVEKDYWLMHVIWGLQKQGYQFELKGGTSLSRGHHIIERFSEDVDIQIHPKTEIPIGKNQNKPIHIEARKDFFDNLVDELEIVGLTFKRDHAFDDDKFRGAGIRGEYHSFFENEFLNKKFENPLKPGILLEVGFDQTTPNTKRNITSWAYDKACSLTDIVDNRAVNVRCYNPEYTFVEKLQTISTKYRKYSQDKSLPINFLRHYYDVYKLLENDTVLKFIGTDKYFEHKNKRFRNADEKCIAENDAFNFHDSQIQELFSNEFAKKSAMYFGKQPSFDEILLRITKHASHM